MKAIIRRIKIWWMLREAHKAMATAELFAKHAGFEDEAKQHTYEAGRLLRQAEEMQAQQ